MVPAKVLAIALAGVAAAIIPYRSAEAYIDPGTGSILLQALIAGAAAVAVAIGGFKSKIAALFHRRAKNKKSDE